MQNEPTTTDTPDRWPGEAIEAVATALYALEDAGFLNPAAAIRDCVDTIIADHLDLHTETRQALERPKLDVKPMSWSEVVQVALDGSNGERPEAGRP